MDLYQESLKAVAAAFDLPENEISLLAETPPRPELGDLAIPCFSLAKRERRSPVQIAATMAEKLKGGCPFWEKVQANGPYVNLFFRRSDFAGAYFNAYQERSDGFAGEKKEGAGETVIIEYSSPNIAKPFHVGHGFSTILGHSLANIHAYLGDHVLRFNHLGDYGTQFGKLIVAWKRWGDEEALHADPITELTRVYVKFHQEAEDDPALVDEGREAFRRLEQGEKEEKMLWQSFRDLSLKEFDKIYDRLGVYFDNSNGECFYSDKIPAVVEKLKDKGILEISEGASVVRLDEDNLIPCMILKSNGTTTYASRDLAAIDYRQNEYHFDRNIYVVGQEQINHFQQVFAVLRKMDSPSKGKCIHVPFGRLSFEDGAFSTRKGQVIRLEEFLDKAVQKVESIIRSNERDMPEEEIADVAEKVGIAAVKYTYLRNSREKDIVFDWDEMLDFDGDTAPYLLYTYARAKSVLRRVDELEETLSSVLPSLLTSDEEFALLKDLQGLQHAAEAASEASEPCLLARHISNMARDFNRFYHNIEILKAEDPALRSARLWLCSCFAEQIAFALRLLGIEAVERM